MVGVYVHLPFCPYVCPYCDFAKWPLRASAAGRYLEALYAEMEAEPAVAAATVFLGGGTPNAYDAETIAQLMARLRGRFGVAGEATIEINPELVRDGDFDCYRDAGITRLSIGVQSFDPGEIRTLGRKHTPGDIARAVASARAASIGSISLDLMFAVPGQTAGTWRESLARAIDLGADHISTYGLTVEPDTPYAAWHDREPGAFFGDGAEAELYGIAIDTLEAAGYEQYEISNFARPGHRCAHNANYWANGEYVGLGVGAASYRQGERWVHTRSLEEYVRAAAAREPIPSERERLHGRKRVGEAIMLALRTEQGVDLAEFKDRYTVDVARDYASAIERLSQAGLLERRAGRLRLTKPGRFVANDVCGEFLTFD